MNEDDFTITEWEEHKAKHVHNWEEVTEFEGMHIYKCECGDSTVEYDAS